MAEPPQAPAPAPASAGFKLKLKLGGSSIGSAGHVRTASLSNNDASTSSSATASTSTPREQPVVAAAAPPSQADVSMDAQSYGDADDLYMDQSSIADDGDDGDFTVGSSKKSKAKRASNTPTLTYSAANDLQAGNAVLPHDMAYEPNAGAVPNNGYPGTSLLAPPPAKKRKAPTANPGAGRGWRKGLKNIEKQEGVSLSLAGGIATPPLAPAVPSKRRKTTVNMAEDGAEDDMDEDFVPTMVAPGAIATSDKWQNGLPGGNEQSRQTAAMAAAVNKLFPVGPPPKTGSGFLPIQPLDKRTPRPRSWKKARREIVAPNGSVFYVPVWAGESESPYAKHMLTHPRPPPIDKKALAASMAAANAGDTGSPFPEGSYAGSDAGVDGTGAAKKRKRQPGEPKRKPGPPKKAKAPAVGAVPIAPVPLAPAQSAVDTGLAQQQPAV